MINNRKKTKKRWLILIKKVGIIAGITLSILGSIKLAIEIYNCLQDDYKISATIKRSFFILPAFYQEEADKALYYIENQEYEIQNSDEETVNEKFIMSFFKDFYTYLGKFCSIKYIWNIEIINNGKKEVTDLELRLPLIEGFYERWGIKEGEDRGYKKIENGIIKIKSIKPARGEKIVLWTYPSKDPMRDYYYEEETKLSHSNGVVDIKYTGEKESFGLIKFIRDSVDTCPPR